MVEDSPERPVTPLGDQAVGTCAEDGLGFLDRFVVPLARRVADRDLRDSTVVGVYGEWGSGKSSLMNMLRRLVAGDDTASGFNPKAHAECLCVTFTAWKYNEEASLWRALVGTVLDGVLALDDDVTEPPPRWQRAWSRLRGKSTRTVQEWDAERWKRQQDLQRIRETLYGEVVEKQRRLRILWARLGGALAVAASLGWAMWSMDSGQESLVLDAVAMSLGAGGAGTLWQGAMIWKPRKDKKKALAGDLAKKLSGAFEVVDDVLRVHQRVEYVEQFATAFQHVVEHFLDGRRLVIFVDDLDRCLPDKAVGVLEGIKLFLSVPNTVFVVGVDVQVLARGIQVHYAQRGLAPTDGQLLGVDGLRYLEKIVQLPFTIPPISPEKLGTSRLAQQLLADGDDGAWLDIGIRGFAGNPRSVKRFATIYRHHLEVLQAHEDSLPEGETRHSQGRELHLAKLLVLREHHRWQALFELMKNHQVAGHAALLRETPLAVLERVARDPEERKAFAEQVGHGGNQALRAFAEDGELMAFLGLEPPFGGEAPVDPIPLIFFGAPPEPESTVPLLHDTLLASLSSPDRLARSRAVDGMRRLEYAEREALVQDFLNRVLLWADVGGEGSERLGDAAQSLLDLLDMGIGTDVVQSRAGQLKDLAAQQGLESRLLGSERARQKLEEVGTKAGSWPPAIQVDPLETDLMDFGGAVDRVRALLLEPGAARLVGVLGPRGSGKSTFLKLLESSLDDDSVTWVLPRELGAAELESTLASLKSLGGDRIVFVDGFDEIRPTRQSQLLEQLSELVESREGASFRVVLTAGTDALAYALGRRKLGIDDYLDAIYDLSLPGTEQLLGWLERALDGVAGREALVALQSWLEPTPRGLRLAASRFMSLQQALGSQDPPISDHVVAMVVVASIRWPALVRSPQRYSELLDRPKRVQGMVAQWEKKGLLLDGDDLLRLLRTAGLPGREAWTRACAAASEWLR